MANSIGRTGETNLTRLFAAIKPYRTVLGLGLLLLVGLGLRWWNIERYGLWIDEITTVNCLGFPLGEILNCHWVQIGSPVHFVATDLVYTLFGRPPLPAPEWMVRFPEILAGTLSILAAWLTARELLGIRGAWLCALLWTCAPTAVAYSQEARMYAWLALFSNLSLWLGVRSLSQRSWRYGILYGVTAALNFYSHYLALAVIAGQFLFASVYLLHRRKNGSEFKRLLLVSASGAVGLGVLIAPWLWSRLSAVSYLLTTPNFAHVPLTLTYLLDAQTWLILDAVGLPFAAFGLVGLQVIGGWWMWRNARTALALVGCCLIIPFAYLLWHQAGFSSMRYWTLVQPPVYLLLTAAGLAFAESFQRILPTRILSPSFSPGYWLVALVGVIALVPGLHQFYSDAYESWRFDDWRGAAEFLRAHVQPNQVVIAFGDASEYHKMALEYYADGLQVFEPNELNGNLVNESEMLQGRVWGIVYARTPQAIKEVRAQAGTDADVYPFTNLMVVSPRPALAQETMRTNLERFVNTFHSFDQDRFALVDALLRDTDTGKNLVANPQWETHKKGLAYHWQMDRKTTQVITLEGEPALQEMKGTTDHTVDTQQTIALRADQLYILHFECRNTLTEGAQRVYVLFNQAVNTQAIFPSGAGYLCPNNVGWHKSSFAFRAPAPSQATILLRNGGLGATYWRHITLSEVSE